MAGRVIQKSTPCGKTLSVITKADTGSNGLEPNTDFLGQLSEDDSSHGVSSFGARDDL